jgi:hypothetical protein
LIEHLGLVTLVITDLDTLTGTGGASAQPAKGAGQKTNNATLKTWVPAMDDVDALVDAEDKAKTWCSNGDPLFAVRVAYQVPVEVMPPGVASPDTALPYTFEDALAFENFEFFSKFEGTGLVQKFRAAIEAGGDAAEIGSRMYQALKNGKKAEFALDVLEIDGFDDLVVPGYIAQGLEWLLTQLRKKQFEILPEVELAYQNAPQPEQAAR